MNGAVEDAGAAPRAGVAASAATVAQLAVATRGLPRSSTRWRKASRPCAGEALLSKERIDPSLRAKQPLAPERIYKPRRGHNDISVLLKSCYWRNKAVIWRMWV